MRYADTKLREEEVRAQKYLDTSGSSVQMVCYYFYFILLKWLNNNITDYYFLVNRKLCCGFGFKLSSHYFIRVYRLD